MGAPPGAGTCEICSPRVLFLKEAAVVLGIGRESPVSREGGMWAVVGEASRGQILLSRKVEFIFIYPSMLQPDAVETP